MFGKEKDDAFHTAAHCSAQRQHLLKRSLFLLLSPLQRLLLEATPTAVAAAAALSVTTAATATAT